MIKKPRMLIVTTKADFSSHLFYSTESKQLIEPHSVRYDSSDNDINQALLNDFKFIYFRDPFNDGSISQTLARKNTIKILNHYEQAYKVDGVSSYEDMLFEDKWNQYKVFARFMPDTKILESLDGLEMGRYFTKKRISARSKGIIFDKDDFPSDANPRDYIKQAKLAIEIEYRVYTVGGKIIQPLAIKSSKSTNSPVKVIGVEDSLDPEIVKICESVYDTTKFDLMGLDIAKTDAGFMLLEVNRSPQFRGYIRVSSLDLANLLSSYLADKTDKEYID